MHRGNVSQLLRRGRAITRQDTVRLDGGTMTSGADVTLGALLLSEYERIKDEQRGRIAFRDNLVYATLASAAAVLAAALRSNFEPALLLLLPPVSILLGWTYLINDQKISAMGRYIRDTLAPRLAAAAGTRDQVFGWETAHRGDARRVSRKRMQLAADLIAFVLTPTAAILTYLFSGPLVATLVVVSALEAAATAVLSVQIVLYADLAS